MDAKRLNISPLQQYLEELHQNLKSYKDGEVASYIPELLLADPEWFGICIATVDGHIYQVGDTQQCFTIQSISKAFVYGMALEDNGVEKMAAKVDVEPSGEAFNSISLRPDTGKPLNPMINAGAIATTAMIKGDGSAAKLERILKSFANYTGHPLKINNDVYHSEKETGHRNRAIVHLLRNFDIIESSPDDNLDVYFQQCSIEVTCRDLAVMGSCLANNGVNPITAVRTLEAKYVAKVLSVMGTCGMYDYSGNWVYSVGMPAKSGVGGGIVAVLPGQLAISVFSPRLDERGNSARGIKVCEQISADYGLHLYHSVRATTATVVRLTYNGSQVQSKRLRRNSDLKYLQTQGNIIHVFRLQGDLMFGSTEAVMKVVLDTLPDGNYFILDLKHVFEVDLAACQLLQKLTETLFHMGKTLLFTHTDGKYGFVRHMKQHYHCINNEKLFAFEDTEHALEYFEDKLLAQRDPEQSNLLPVELEGQELCQNLSEEGLQKLRAIAKLESYEADTTIFKCGDPADSLYLIVEGEAEVSLPTDARHNKRLAMLSPGMSFGEMALLNYRTRSADVRTTCHSKFYQVIFDDIPDDIRAGFVTNIAEQLARKLGRETREMKHLD